MFTPDFLKRLEELQSSLLKDAENHFNQTWTWTTTTPVEEEKPVSHTIWICTVNNEDVVDRIVAAIVGLGAEVGSAASNNTLFHKQAGAQTTIAALSVKNFKSDLKNSQILDKVCAAIKKLDYYGIVIQNSKGGAAWRAGNIVSGKNLQNSLNKAQDSFESEEETKETPKETEEPVLDGKVSVQLLTRIVRATCEMSDIFFDDISQQDRKLLARELEKLCERDNISLGDLPKT